MKGIFMTDRQIFILAVGMIIAGGIYLGFLISFGISYDMIAGYFLGGLAVFSVLYIGMRVSYEKEDENIIRVSFRNRRKR